MYNKYIQTYLNIICQSRKDDYYQQLLRAKNNYNQQLYTREEAKELSEILFSYNNPKKEKMTLWFLIKGTIKLPEDQYKIDQAFNLVQKQHLNFQEFSTPQEIINRKDQSTKRINEKYIFNPDTQPTFSDKKVLKNGIIIYNVQDSKEGQIAVRKAIDVNWGYDANPWCLAARIDISQDNDYSDDYDDYNDDLSEAWQYWSTKYNVYPKRIAFQNGKLLAFCANEEKKILWWDRNDKSSSNIPGLQNKDDPEWFNFQYNIIRIARDPNTPIEILIRLVNINNFDGKYAMAKNPNAPYEILNKLVNDNDFLIKRCIVNNPNTPQKILQKLSNDKNQYIRQKVASHPNTSLEILNKLSNDKEYMVRQAVVENPNTSIEILEKLANDENWQVRYIVAKNQNTPIEVLTKLSNDENSQVRYIVAKNPNTPLEILIKLSDSYEDARLKVVKNQNTPPEILSKFVNDANYRVRLAIAENPNTPLKILQKLSNDEDYDIRQNVAKNLNTPPEILQKLADDKEYIVRQAVADNPNTPIDILKYFAYSPFVDPIIAKHALNNINNIKNDKNT